MSFDIEPRQLIYNRTGNFSQTTTIDRELAEQFMKASDLRLDVVIIDSDKKPEQSVVTVGSNVLAWRSIVPLSELTKIVLRPKKFREVEIINDQYRIQIHDQVIDNDIRKRNPQSIAYYEKMYLTRLRKEVTGGLVETIRWEKLGLRTQFMNWLQYFSSFAFASILSTSSYQENPDPKNIALYAAFTTFIIHPMYAIISNIAMQRHQQFDHFRSRLHPDINPRDWKHAFMPIVPVDKWLKGRIFLAQHGAELIIARS